jgi:hypothetical protein
MGRQRITPADIFLAILAILLISVSFYQTWLGLEQIFGPSSFIIALVLSLLLLFLIWMLREAKLNGESTSKLMGIYIFIAIFCFMANFNALYTRFMKTDIFTTELRDINENFNKLEAEVNSKFNYKYNKETTQNIEIKKKQLVQQIQDKGNPGFGERSKALISDIEKLLSQRIDILQVVGKDYEDLAERMGKQIDGMVSDLSPEEAELKSDINIAVLKWNKKVQELLLLSNKEKDDVSQGLIDHSLTEYNKLGNRAHTILGDEKFKFEIVTSKTQEVGKIGYAFGHAIKNFGVYQFVVLLGCLLLDFIIPIIVILVTKTKSNDGNNHFSGSVFTTKRKSNVLIPNN